MKMLTGVRKRHLVDIEFQDLSYIVKQGFRSETKTILRAVSGIFYSGELTAILGTSGSGKTTLLNILAGCTSKGVTGNIKVNNKKRDIKLFQKLAAYIMQETMQQPLLTVKESMIISAKLKLGNNISYKEKLVIVEEILTVLGLENASDTMTEKLSGGESKRLSIALELVNNPPVIFLDEPTSGLDTVAMRQCLETLKVLTGEGRTVICSIHQPSASSFKLFDQTYFIANGMCVYNGSPSNAISFLSSLGLPCPTTYNPAEYIIEVIQINQDHIPTLVESSQNGKSDIWHASPLTMIEESHQKQDHISIYQNTTEESTSTHFATSFWTQFIILFQRMMLQERRNKLRIGIQMLVHLLCVLIFGGLFYQVGNNGAYTHFNYAFSISVMVFFVFTYSMTPVLLFPTELQLIKVEYSNQWYGLKAYYLALMLRSIPLMFSLGLFFLASVYWLTNQPMEIYRFTLFASGGLLVAITSEAFGLIVGTIFTVTNGALAGPGLIAPMMVLSYYGMGQVYNEIALPIKIAMSMSYMRFGAGALSLGLLGAGDPLECFQIFCLYKDPTYLLHIMGIPNVTYTSRMLGLFGFTVIFKLLGYFVLRHRLNPESSHMYLGCSSLFKFR